MDVLKWRFPELTRERLVNPHEGSFAERVRAAGAAKLHPTFRIEELGGGYSRIIPSDAQWVWKDEDEDATRRP